MVKYFLQRQQCVRIDHLQNADNRLQRASDVSVINEDFYSCRFSEAGHLPKRLCWKSLRRGNQLWADENSVSFQFHQVNGIREVLEFPQVRFCEPLNHVCLG